MWILLSSVFSMIIYKFFEDSFVVVLCTFSILLEQHPMRLQNL